MIDARRIADLRDEVGSDDLAEVVALFCEEAEEVLAALDDGSTIEQLHFLKGSALNIGMTGVGALCLAEESRLRDDALARPDIDAIRDAYLAARSALLDLL